MPANLSITILGLSITSSWGNGHATTFRHLAAALAARGHEVVFLERDVPWYAAARDLPDPPYARTCLYSSVEQLQDELAEPVRNADLVIVGSYVPDGVQVGQWALATARGITAFYDIDTPVTLHKLQTGDYEYLTPELIGQYDIYLSFAGGPILTHLEERFGAQRARPLYCSVDPDVYYPEPNEPRFDLGYMGTYSHDRQPTLARLLLQPAQCWPTGRFVVAGPQYPASIRWPANVQRIEHLPPEQHRAFYTSQRFTLNVTRQDMIRTGYAPSIRLFEAAACGTPIISDRWPGLDQFLRVGKEILVASKPDEVLHALTHMNDRQRQQLRDAARQRVLQQHTGRQRAIELEGYLDEVKRLARTV